MPPLFPNAKLLVQRAEWDLVRAMHPWQAPWYQPGTYDDLRRGAVEQIEGDVLLGPGVALLATPGHSAGMMSLVLNTSTGIWASSENVIAAEMLTPEHTGIPGVRKTAERWGLEVILNGNTLENTAAQYNSVVKEKCIVDRSAVDGRFLQFLPTSELTRNALMIRTSPTFVHGRVQHGRLVRESWLPEARSRTFVVTGGASGIGRSLVRRLHGLGHRVLATDVNEPGLRSAAEADGWAGSERAVGRVLDVRDPAAWRDVVADAATRWGRLDVLINVAGVLFATWAHESTDAQVDQTIDVNVKGMLHGTNAALRVMVPRKAGHVVNVASIAGLVPVPGLAAYSASKHAARPIRSRSPPRCASTACSSPPSAPRSSVRP